MDDTHGRVTTNACVVTTTGDPQGLKPPSPRHIDARHLHPLPINALRVTLGRQILATASISRSPNERAESRARRT